MSDNLREIVDITARRLLDDIARSLYEPSPLLKCIAAQRKAEWDALPWHEKMRRRIKRRASEAGWRVRVAFDVLRKGGNSTWLDGDR